MATGITAKDPRKPAVVAAIRKACGHSDARITLVEVTRNHYQGNALIRSKKSKKWTSLGKIQVPKEEVKFEEPAKDTPENPHAVAEDIAKTVLESPKMKKELKKEKARQEKQRKGVLVLLNSISEPLTSEAESILRRRAISPAEDGIKAAKEEAAGLIPSLILDRADALLSLKEDAFYESVWNRLSVEEKSFLILLVKATLSLNVAEFEHMASRLFLGSFSKPKNHGIMAEIMSVINTRYHQATAKKKA